MGVGVRTTEEKHKRRKGHLDPLRTESKKTGVKEAVLARELSMPRRAGTPYFQSMPVNCWIRKDFVNMMMLGRVAAARIVCAG